MDEYFCPNCGAILNDQYGFDPDGGTWTCTECGKLLMDEDVYNGDSYEGVAWYCNECGAHLHHCYSDDEYSVVGEAKHICPNCGAALDDQRCFVDYQDNWECTECGVHLHHSYSDDPYTVVEENNEEDNMYKCPSCGTDVEFLYGYPPTGHHVCYCGKNLYFCQECHALLNTQDGFYDYCDLWMCEECCYENKISDNVNESAEDHVENSGYYGKGYSKNYNPNVGETYSYSSNNTQYYGNTYDYTIHSSQKEEYTEQKTDSQLFFKRLKSMIFNKKQITIEKSVNDLVGSNADYVQKQLKNMGFNNIKAIAVPDIYVNSTKQVGEVEQVVINGQSWFEENDKAKYDAEIIITYHIKKKVVFPYSSKQMARKNYDNVVQHLFSLGYTEIYTSEIKDLVTGWLKKDGSIEKVIINGDSVFKKGMSYDYDIRIEISYHTFSKK